MNKFCIIQNKLKMSFFNHSLLYPYRVAFGPKDGQVAIALYGTDATFSGIKSKTKGNITMYEIDNPNRWLHWREKIPKYGIHPICDYIYSNINRYLGFSLNDTTNRISIHMLKPQIRDDQDNIFEETRTHLGGTTEYHITHLELSPYLTVIEHLLNLQKPSY